MTEQENIGFPLKAIFQELLALNSCTNIVAAAKRNNNNRVWTAIAVAAITVGGIAAPIIRKRRSNGIE